jgi:hypothetical protein
MIVRLVVTRFFFIVDGYRLGFALAVVSKIEGIMFGMLEKPGLYRI